MVHFKEYRSAGGRIKSFEYWFTGGISYLDIQKVINKQQEHCKVVLPESTLNHYYMMPFNLNVRYKMLFT